ncbi:anti-sigma factor [Alsobacter sp. KACC 23698]|uniref:Anti-sigma factor n=1 Tax=Alsobacter sp. KACC 23698 TaxID=3149229 RepID=A0AAU7JHG9_9HYPH
MTEGFPDTSGDLDRLAAEFALSLLEEGERKRAEDRYEHDAAFRALVDSWREQFAGFVDELAPRPPQPATWGAIESQLGRPPVQGPRRPRIRWWDDVRVWRPAAMAGLASAAAMLLVAVVALRNDLAGEPASPSVTASAGSLGAALLPKEGPALFIVTYQLGSNWIVIVPTRRPVPDTGRYVLSLMNGDDDPIVLGVIERERTSQLMLSPSRAQLLSAGVILVLTRDSAEDSSGAQASSGTVLAKGVLEMAKL